MSADLQVKLSTAISIERMKLLTELTLQELLDLSFKPTLHAQELRNGVLHPLSTSMVGKDQALIFKLNREEESVFVVVVEIPRQHLVSDEEAGLWVSISVAGTQSPLEYALAASMAIGLAKEMSTAVVDHALLWSPLIETRPSELARKLRVPGPTSDMRAAAEAMYSSLPLGQAEKDMNS